MDIGQITLSRDGIGLCSLISRVVTCYSEFPELIDQRIMVLGKLDELRTVLQSYGLTAYKRSV